MNANAARACLAGFFLALGAASVLRAEIKPLVVEGAPFPLTVQEWTPPARDFPITAYGAKPDGTAVTEAIEAAIDAAEEIADGEQFRNFQGALATGGHFFRQVLAEEDQGAAVGKDETSRFYVRLAVIMGGHLFQERDHGIFFTKIAIFPENPYICL